MMALRFAYTRPDGGTSIVIAAPKDTLLHLIGAIDQFGEWTLTDENYKSHVMNRSIPDDATNVHELPDEWVAPSREFRDAWVNDGKAVSVDIDAAKAIKSGRLVKSGKMTQALADQIAAAKDVDELSAIKRE